MFFIAAFITTLSYLTQMAVVIVTRFGLDVSGLELRLGREFPYFCPGAHQSPVQWITGLFFGHKAAGAWRWPPNPNWRRG